MNTKDVDSKEPPEVSTPEKNQVTTPRSQRNGSTIKGVTITPTVLHFSIYHGYSYAIWGLRYVVGTRPWRLYASQPSFLLPLVMPSDTPYMYTAWGCVWWGGQYYFCGYHQGLCSHTFRCGDWTVYKRKMPWLWDQSPQPTTTSVFTPKYFFFNHFEELVKRLWSSRFIPSMVRALESMSLCHLFPGFKV